MISVRSWIKLIVTITVLGIIALLVYRRLYPSERWGAGDLGILERSYYSNRVHRVLDFWLESRKDSANYHEDGGRMKDGYNIMLVVDTNESGIWIEQAGRINPDYCTELPANMKWAFYRATSEGVAEMPGRTRLKMRGYYMGLQDPERFHLVGTGRGWAQVKYYFTACQKNGYHSYTKPFVPKPYHAGSKRTEMSYASLVVDDSEYLASAPAAEAENDIAQSPVHSNMADFREVEELLYRRIAGNIVRQGYSVRYVNIAPEADYTKALAHIGIYRTGLLHTYFRGKYCGGASVQIDYLGDKTWYVSRHFGRRSAQQKAPEDLDLELLLRSNGDIPRPQRKKLLEKGRSLQPSKVAS